MNAYAEREDAGASSLNECSEPNCKSERWRVTKRGQTYAVSLLCFDHANVRMFDVPPEPPKAAPEPKSVPFHKGEKRLSAFHAEVRRQRLGRQGSS
jgi:hypothetical protein